MGMGLSGGFAAGAGADALEELLKQAFAQQVERKRAAQEDQRIKIEQQRANDATELRKLDQEAAAQTRAGNQQAQAQTGAIKLRGQLRPKQEVSPEQIATLTKGGFGEDVTPATLSSRNIGQNMTSTPNPGRGPSFAGTPDQLDEQAQGAELDRQIAMASPQLRGRLSMAKLLPADKRSTAISEVMREEAKPTSQPVMRIGRNGTMQQIGEAPTGAHFVTEPAPTNINMSGMNALYSATDPKAIAAGIRSGEMPPDISQYGRPVQGAVASELAKPGPRGEHFNLADAQRTWNAQKRLNSTMNGAQQVRIDQSIKSGMAMYDKIDALADQWDGKGWGPLSRVNLQAAIQGAKGPEAANKAIELQGQIAQLTSDVATLEQGGMTPTNEARQVAEKSMQAWWGNGTIHAMTAQGRANMKIRDLARQTQDTFVVGRTGGQADTSGSGTAKETPEARLKRLMSGG